MPSGSDNSNISRHIIEYIQTLILEGELRVGDRLPSERKFSEKLNVSRPALREALRALELLGIVEMNHGQGNYIVNHIMDSMLKPLAISFKLDNGCNEDIMEFRLMTERFIAGNAAVNASPDDIAALYSLHRSMVTATTIQEKVDYDRRLHMRIAMISNNKLVRNVFSNASYLFDMFTSRTVAIAVEEETITRIYSQHHAIIKAIEAGDSMLAIAKMEEHLNSIEPFSTESPGAPTPGDL